MIEFTRKNLKGTNYYAKIGPICQFDGYIKPVCINGDVQTQTAADVRDTFGQDENRRNSNVYEGARLKFTYVSRQIFTFINRSY